MIKLIFVAVVLIASSGCQSLQDVTLNENLAMIKAQNECSGAALKSHDRLGKDPMEVYERCLDIRLSYN
ncbi:hypothetical protein OTK49_03020 [Vibrio coralliirubri]|uniref:hypothetical protein n=1 Tax=Vibrio coralliirubri TaxID=1516159 RepID=UPI0022845E23|nr:hypothetical protein [Vibrio coralliirubri]MCY9861487.1 hypothetical protein [Vibrio coralliirubri]